MMRYSLLTTLALSLATPTQAQLPADLTPVLVPAEVGWKVGTPKADLVVAQVDGQPVFRVGAGGLTLTSKEKITSDVELRIRFRMASPDDKGSNVSIIPGLEKDTLNIGPLRAYLAVNAGPEPDALYWQFPPLPDQKAVEAGRYGPSKLPKNRLTWPEFSRRRFEADHASEPKLTQAWLTLRYQLRKNAVRVFLDDRVLRDAQHPKMETSGFVYCSFSRGIEIASLSVAPLPATDRRYETVALDGYLNADKFRNEPVALDKRQVQAGPVPFVLPQADARKRTHIDLKPSWFAPGLVAGDFYAGVYEIGRWSGALHRERGRIQFRVPNGAYTKLHVLCAASGEADTIPQFTAQFYRPGAGAPVNFVGEAPLFSAQSANALPFNAGKTQGNLHLVTIPLQPNGLSSFAGHDYVEFELTKKVRTYRGFPDPIQYSEHAGGLPSGVHVFGITFERPAVEIDLQPDAFAHTWTAPAKPSYTVKLKNNTDKLQEVLLNLGAIAGDTSGGGSGGMFKVPANGEERATLTLDPARYGHHTVTLVAKNDGETQVQERTLAYLHPDTRERGNWAEGKGPIFGLWDWNGAHGTPAGLPRLKLMGAVGMESAMTSFANYPQEEKDYLESIGAQSFFLGYQINMSKLQLGGKDWDPTKPAEMQAALIDYLKKQPMAQASKINYPELVVFFAEPLLGPVSYMSHPEHYGEPPYEMTPEEKTAYKRYHDMFVIAGQAIKKEWPKAKLLFPWGIPSFPIPFLRHSKEARELMDGPAIDVVLFERLPEMQLHQVTLSNVMWQLKQEWNKSGKPWPTFSTIEGPAISPAAPGALSAQQESDHTVRSYMILAAYGTTRHLGWPVGFHCSGYWGETHYGGGMCDRLPLLTPRPVLSTYATLTRQLNRMNFVQAVPTGSNTVFCYQFKHYKTGELQHVVWTLKGTRPVDFEFPNGEKAVHIDSMDNVIATSDKNRLRITASSTPCYVRGLKSDVKITLGEPDHSDAQPAAQSVKLGHLADGTWKLSDERDLVYEDSHSEFIRRFPGKFSIHQGDKVLGKALAVRLEKQDKERKTMPFYTTLVPAKPIVIPGKPSHLGIHAKASSDWGRVVYCLKDAKGERWISVGLKGEWNVDDTHCWSQFCYDGNRYLRFEMPANSPYDLYREMGTTYWGHYGPGDAVVDYPLTLEKILVERRTHVIAGTELVAASTDDVHLGGLYAEYETPLDKTPEAIRLSKLRMPVPAVLPDLDNPLKKLAETGTGDGPTIAKVTPPEREYDGRRCHVEFNTLESAVKYNIWVSPYADGRGAILLGANWTKSGQLLTNLNANVDLYLFVVAIDAAGKSTKPGKAFKINLKDMFPMK